MTENNNDTIENKINTYKYPISSILKVSLLLIIFSLGIFFSLNFFAISNQSDFFSTFDPSLKEKTILIVNIIFPISVISLIVAGLYLYEFLCSIRLENDKLIKRMPFSKEIKIDVNDIINIKSYKFILLSQIEGNQNKIYFFPSLNKYRSLMKKLIDKVNNNNRD